MSQRALRLLPLLLICAFAPVLLAQANLTLDSFGTFQQFAPGSHFSVHADFSNSGPIAASNVKLTITVPPGFQYEGYTGQSPFNCTEPPKDGPGDLVCTASSLGIIDFVSIDTALRVDPAAVPGTVITMSATLTSSNAVKPSQTISGSTTVIPSTNLRIEMSAPASVTLGSNSFAPSVTFPITFTVTNDGPVTATFTEVDIARQSLVSWSQISAPPGWHCITGACTIGSFPPGTATFTISATILSSSPLTSVREQAQVWSYSDGDFSDNQVTSSTAIIKPPKSTLAPGLTAAPDVVFTGDQLTYTATITNTSSVDAQNVTLSWTLPGTPLATTCGTLASAYCSFPTLAAGASLTVTRTVRVDAGPGNRLFASVLPGAENSDPVFSNTAVLITYVAGTPHVDLGVAIAPFDTSFHAGGSATWQFQVTNLGPDPATDWQLTIPLPPNTTLAGGSAGSATCSSLTPNPATTQVTCHGTYLTKSDLFLLRLDLALAPGAYAPVHMTASVSPGTNVDTNPANNTAAVDTPVFTTAYMAVGATTDKTTAAGGERVTHTFTAINHGPDTALDVQLNVTLPPGAAFVAMNSTFASCTGTGPIHCVAPLVPAGTSLQTAVSFQAPPSPNLYGSNAVLLWGSSFASAFDQSNASVQLRVVGASSGSDVAVSLDVPPTVNMGEDFTYTIGAWNLGAADASNVAVQFTLPPSLALVFESLQCSGTAVVTCNAGTLYKGSSKTFIVTARALQTGTTTATANITTTSPESNGNNNTATATVSAVAPPPPADVAISIDAAPATVQTGDVVTYTFTARDAGTAAATDVTVHFGLPSALTFLSASPGCTGTSAIVCTAGTLDNGSSAVFVVTARAVEAGSITATASVSTTSFDPNSRNNSGTATVTISAPPPPPPARRRAAHH